MQKSLDFRSKLSKQLDKVVASLRPEDQEATLSILRKIFGNIIEHPNNDKYCQIKLAGKTFSSKVWRHPACQELMIMSGWVVEDDHVRLKDDLNVHIVSQLLQSFCRQKDIKPSMAFPDNNSTKYSVDKFKSLISAVLNVNISEIKSLLKPHNISTSGKVYCENGSSADLFYSAILYQKIDIVKLLVEYYSVNSYEADNGEMPIVFYPFIAAPQSFCIKFLKTCGVVTSFKTNDGTTLLQAAVFTCCFQVVCFLVEECGADVNISNNYLQTPLHTAYLAGHTRIAEYLIQHGADVMAVDAMGCTPYYFIDGIPAFTVLSKTLQNSRIIHQVPGSDEHRYYIKLCNIGIEYQNAVTLTMDQFPSLTEDGPTQRHHDIDQASFTQELTQYITKTSSSGQPWGQLKSDQAKHLQFML